MGKWKYRVPAFGDGLQPCGESVHKLAVGANTDHSLNPPLQHEANTDHKRTLGQVKPENSFSRPNRHPTHNGSLLLPTLKPNFCFAPPSPENGHRGVWSYFPLVRRSVGSFCKPLRARARGRLSPSRTWKCESAPEVRGTSAAFVGQR